jgi:hypothetical protein
MNVLLDFAEREIVTRGTRLVDVVGTYFAANMVYACAHTAIEKLLEGNMLGGLVLIPATVLAGRYCAAYAMEVARPVTVRAAPSERQSTKA